MPTFSSRCNVDGQEYLAFPEIDGGCEGCVGKHSAQLCHDLPRGCAKQDIIWVKRTPETLAQFIALKLEN